jgi:hypothetical protein
MTQDTTALAQEVLNDRFRDFEERHTAKGPPILASSGKFQWGGASIYDQLNLQYVARGWFLYPDGATRSNEGSKSDLSEPPVDAFHKWCLIHEYHRLAHYEVTQRYNALYEELKERLKWAVQRHDGTEPTKDELRELEGLKRGSGLAHLKIKNAARMIRRYRPKGLSVKQRADNEAVRYEQRAARRLEELAPKNPSLYMPDPTKMRFPDITTETTIYDDPRRVRLEGMPQSAYESPKRVRLDGYGV